MENASKALIIAGAILLAILLISLGIMIFTQAQDTVTNSGMSEAELQSFNSKFLKYEGNMKGTMVKSLIQEVSSNNGNENNAERKVTLNSKEFPATNSINNNSTYSVVMKYDSTTGRINQIDVYEGKDKTSGTKATV